MFSAESTDLSALHAAVLRPLRAPTSRRCCRSTGGAQQDRIVGGSVRIAEAHGRRARRPGAARRARSARIDHDDDGVRVDTRDGDERRRASHVIVTLPPTLAGRLEYGPALPSWRDQLTQRLPAGSVIKLYAVYPEPFWRADGLNGQAASDEGPVKVTFDNSPPVGHARAC